MCVWSHRVPNNMTFYSRFFFKFNFQIFKNFNSNFLFLFFKGLRIFRAISFLNFPTFFSEFYFRSCIVKFSRDCFRIFRSFIFEIFEALFQIFRMLITFIFDQILLGTGQMLNKETCTCLVI